MSCVIPVRYEGKPCYDIHLEQDFSKLLGLLRELGYQKERKICILTDTNVAPLYLDEVKKLLEDHFFLCTSHVISAGEEYKNTDTVGSVYEHLISEGFDRKDLLVALGGGVVGDLTGFTAATYLRGIDFVQIPTTLLSQVDSSIGGKTGVDFMQYKNMVGAFYMPRLVYMNLSALATLPRRQFLSGMAEILKHGQIKDAAYFDRTAESYEAILAKQPEALEKMIAESCIIKGDVVERDPKEKGERALLNFGHTIGHAIEKLSDFHLLHGECVALGMAAAAYLSCKYGSYSEKDFERLIKALKLYRLPVQLKQPGFSPEEILTVTRLDKKMESGKIKFILLEKPGDAYITRKLKEDEILDGIRYLFP